MSNLSPCQAKWLHSHPIHFPLCGSGRGAGGRREEETRGDGNQPHDHRSNREIPTLYLDTTLGNYYVLRPMCGNTTYNERAVYSVTPYAPYAQYGVLLGEFQIQVRIPVDVLLEYSVKSAPPGWGRGERKVRPLGFRKSSPLYSVQGAGTGTVMGARRASQDLSLKVWEFSPRG